jgi:N-acetyl-anhydromuramyl-L-alanine amidase AmpD
MGNLPIFFCSVLLLIIEVTFINGIHITEHNSQFQDERLVSIPDMLYLSVSQTHTNCSSLLPILTGQTQQTTQSSSYHYIICEDQKVYRLVAESDRAWFSPQVSISSRQGTPYWHGRKNFNDWAIGILSLDASDQTTGTLAELIKDIRKRFIIPDVHIIGEFDVRVYEEQKNYVLPFWRNLNSHGIGIFPNETNINNARKENISGEDIFNAYLYLKQIGYKISPQGDSIQTYWFNRSISAFQRRFLNNKSGVTVGLLDPLTFAALKATRDLYVTEYQKFWNCYLKPEESPQGSLSINTSYESTNQNERLMGPPFMIVLHNTELNFSLSLKVLVGNTSSQVSAHYLVDLNGNVYRLVNESRRAWQAGVSTWGGYNNLNDVSIGIEIVNENSAKLPYPNVQINAVADLIQDIRSRWWIPDEFILTHEGIAPNRRRDPGHLFPWTILADRGIGPWFKNVKQRTKFQTGKELKNVDNVEAASLALAKMGFPIDSMAGKNGNEMDNTIFRECLQRFQWRYLPESRNQTPALDQPTMARLKEMEHVYTQLYSKHAPRCLSVWKGNSSAGATTSINNVLFTFLLLAKKILKHL